MTNEETAKKKLIGQNRKFGYPVACASLLLAGYRVFWRDQPWWWLLSGFGFVLLLMTLIMPGRIGPLRYAWEKLGHIIGTINTYVVLTIFYFFVLSPLVVLMRLFGKDILKLKWRSEQDSYWEKDDCTAQRRMEDQF